MVAERRNTNLEAVGQMSIPNHLPKQQPDSPHVVRRRIEKKPKRNFYTLKMLLAVCGLGIFGLMFIQLYMDSQINHIHYETQIVRMNINSELTRNEELNARISELSQYSRIIEVATERGLILSENIINIEK